MLANDIIRLSGALLFVPLLWLTANVAETSQSGDNLEVEQLQIIQNVNLYLINLNLKLDEGQGQQQVQKVSDEQLTQMRKIRMALRNAAEELELVRQGVLDEAYLEEKYKPLLADINKGTLSVFLANLREPFSRCDQERIDHLVLIANYRKKTSILSIFSADDHLLVQNYAKLRVQLCWKRFVEWIEHNIDKTLDKMQVPLFKYMDHVAISMQSGTERRSADTIKIDDKKAEQKADSGKTNKNEAKKLFDRDSMASSLDSADSNKLQETLQALKEVRLTSAQNRKDFALALNRMFNAQVKHFAKGGGDDDDDDDDDGGGGGGGRRLGTGGGLKRKDQIKRELQEFYEDLFERPCQELVSRFRSNVPKDHMFKGHIKQSLGNALTEEAQTNMKFDYKLQIYRICRKLEENTQLIFNILLRMR